MSTHFCTHSSAGYRRRRVSVSVIRVGATLKAIISVILGGGGGVELGCLLLFWGLGFRV